MVEVSEANEGLPASSLWGKVSVRGRMVWMRAAGYTLETAMFAASMEWRYLPESCQVKLMHTQLPVNYEG